SGELVGGYVDQLQLGREVRMGVAADQPPVFVAGVLAEAATALPAIALHPLIEEGQEGDRARLLEPPAVAVGFALALDPARRVEGAGASLPLLAGDFDDGDVTDDVALAIHALVDARRLGLDEPPLVAAPATVRTD